MLTDTVRSCALAGCDAPVIERPGRPTPTYCSAAHRARAREARRAERYRVPALDRPDPAAPLPAGVPVPWQPEPPGGTRGIAGLARQVLRRRAAARKEVRRRALASLGAAGIMVAAGGFAVSSSSEQQAQQALDQLGRNGFSAEAGYEWAYRANLTLASLNRQIDELTLADQQWRALGRVDPGLPAVRDLQSRLALLNQQRTVLLAQLAAWESWQRSQADLAAAEAQLARADLALRESPADGRSTQAVAAHQQLLAIRDLRREQRDAKVAERDTLQRAVATAVQNPVPDDPGRTAAVTGAVRDLDKDPLSPPADTKRRQVPAIVTRDGNGDRPKEDVETGAPPRERSGGDLLGTVAAAGEGATGGSGTGAAERDGADTGVADTGVADTAQTVTGGAHTGPLRSASTSGSDAQVARGAGGGLAETALASGMAWAAATGYPAARATQSSDGTDSSSEAADSSRWEADSSSDYPSGSDHSDHSTSSDRSSDSEGSSSDSSSESSADAIADYVEAAYSGYEASTR